MDSGLENNMLEFNFVLFKRKKRNQSNLSLSSTESNTDGFVGEGYTTATDGVDIPVDVST